NGDTNPVTLVALKSIQSATADASTVNLPANSTTLRVTASDHAEGDSVFTWTKVSGPGSVSFTPNGTSATASTVQFDGTEGTYQFEVTMSDSRGLTEAYETVTVVLSGGGGGDVTPPVPNPASFSSTPSAPGSSSITMTATAGSDASGTVEYLFTETSGNPGGTSSGWQSSRSYTDGGLNANTQYTYTVTMRDGLGNTGTASAPASATTGGGGGGPASLKVFILAGQSNMEGHGEMNPVGTQGTLDYLVANDPGNYGHLKDGSNWSSRDDVWMWYKRGGSTLLTGDLTAGYGAKSDTIGPELQFGHVMGDVYGEKVLIIKTAWGGKSLAVDYRPPSSGWTVNPPNAAGDEGYYYQEMMSYVNDVLGNLSTYFPEYDAAAGYELAGFGWHQGWNDRVNQEHNDQYEANLVNLINDVRADLGVPGLPFVIATTGMSGWSETHPRALSLMNAQLAMEDFVKYPAFDGNVAVVETRDFWRDSTVSPSNQNYHWNRNAETYCLIGTAMAQEMQGLIAGGGGGDVSPPTPNPAGFASAPAAGGSTSISMTAITGSDASGPVEYLFSETSGNPGGTSSGWQTSPNYTDSGLNASTQYTYTVRMRDALGNTGSASAGASATTSGGGADTTPPNPNPMTWASVPSAVTSGGDGALIYEPFDMSTGDINGQATGAGLNGN
ncbi:MAG: sialate O-acetylesterase, partial [Haloferula sp.]